MCTIVFPTVLHTFECLFCQMWHLDTVSLHGLKKPPKLFFVLDFAREVFEYERLHTIVKEVKVTTEVAERHRGIGMIKDFAGKEGQRTV